LKSRVEMPRYRKSRSALSDLLPSIVTMFCSAVIAISLGAKPATASEI